MASPGQPVPKISVYHKDFNGPVNINAEDFDPKVHTRVEDVKAMKAQGSSKQPVSLPPITTPAAPTITPAPSAPSAPSAPAPSAPSAPSAPAPVKTASPGKVV